MPTPPSFPPPTPPEFLTLLRGVSRSFYLSIRLLPAPLRRPIAVAYLLARATDTLADTAELQPVERQRHLQTLAGVIDGRLPPAVLPALAAAFASLQHDAHERALIRALPQCLAWLEMLAPDDQRDIRTVLRHITHGQALDIERFGPAGSPRALATADALEEYTYLVAGSVGEFWTDLCLRHVPSFANAAPPDLREWGRRYGMALQLVNILRDAGPDLAAGRCYFPADELAAAGIAPAGILEDPERFEPIWLRWHAKAQEGLHLGMRYADAVNSRRIRAASALPALLAARTLELLRTAGPRRMQSRVKVPRAEVRSLLARLAFSLAGRAQLLASFRRLGAKATPSGWDNPRP